ncbi:MAG: FKBP-type peptidyl-prolyl cis-trans isomerase [Acidobacteriota bacterium]
MNDLSRPSKRSPLVLMVACVALLLAAPALPAQEGAAAAAEADNSDTFKALGMMVSQQLAPLGITDEELELIFEGIRAGLAGDTTINPRDIMPKIQALAAERTQIAAEAERAAAAEFLTAKTEAAKAKGGVVTESGLIYTELAAGTGASPTATDRVKVHYHGTLRDGTVFDSSKERGEPVTFGLNQVIKCWTEGVAKMKVGGKAELVCPAGIAYGDRGQGLIKPGAALVFEVELLEIATESAS